MKKVDGNKESKKSSGIITNPVLYSKHNGNAVTIRSKVKWYKRLWYIISNPITYIFAGRIRY